MRHLFSANKLVIATHNDGKVREFERLMAIPGLQLMSAGALGLPEPEETGRSFFENARLKAVAAAKASGLPALADDSGLCVEALDGAPGIYSARWAGPDKNFLHAMEKILAELKMRRSENHKAAFIAALVLAFPDQGLVSAEGRIDGELMFPGRGEHGFGYDPFFVPEGNAKTFAQMAMEEKAAYSHRAKAMAALIEKMNGSLVLTSDF